MEKNVLLVDDDNSLRHSLQLLLEESNYKVFSASTGRGALKALQIETFYAIILDVNLPFIQGSELLGLIRAQDRKVKIIMVSGLFDNETRQKVMEQGADSIVEKPFEFQELLKHLN